VQYNSLHVLFPKKTFALACGVGAGITLISTWGYCASKKQNKCMLTIYALVMLALVAAEVGAGAYVIKYAHTVEQDHNTGDALNQLLECSFDFCCKPSPEDKKCHGLDQWIDTGDNKNVCSILPDAYQKGGSGCGSFPVYRAGVVEWFKDHDLPIGIALVSVGGLQFLGVCAALALICAKKEPKALSEEERQALYYEQNLENGGALAYGTGGPIATAEAVNPPNTALTYA